MSEWVRTRVNVQDDGEGVSERLMTEVRLIKRLNER